MERWIMVLIGFSSGPWGFERWKVTLSKSVMTWSTPEGDFAENFSVRMVWMSRLWESKSSMLDTENYPQDASQSSTLSSWCWQFNVAKVKAQAHTKWLGFKYICPQKSAIPRYSLQLRPNHLCKNGRDRCKYRLDGLGRGNKASHKDKKKTSSS